MTYPPSPSSLAGLFFPPPPPPPPPSPLSVSYPSISISSISVPSLLPHSPHPPNSLSSPIFSLSATPLLLCLSAVLFYLPFHEHSVCLLFYSVCHSTSTLSVCCSIPSAIPLALSVCCSMLSAIPLALCLSAVLFCLPFH